MAIGANALHILHNSSDHIVEGCGALCGLCNSGDLSADYRFTFSGTWGSESSTPFSPVPLGTTTSSFTPEFDPGSIVIETSGTIYDTLLNRCEAQKNPDDSITGHGPSPTGIYSRPSGSSRMMDDGIATVTRLRLSRSAPADPNIRIEVHLNVQQTSGPEFVTSNLVFDELFPTPLDCGSSLNVNFASYSGFTTGGGTNYVLGGNAGAISCVILAL